MVSIIQDNIRCLQQGIALLNEIDSADYTAVNPEVSSGTIGAHIRHNLDHFLCLINQLDSGRVNYDERARDEKIEIDPAHACAVMETLVKQLESLSEDALTRPLLVRMDCGSDEEDNWSDSTLRREFQFLISHTIHHYALIGILCRLRGLTLPSDFGVAPSTLKFQQRQGTFSK